LVSAAAPRKDREHGLVIHTAAGSAVALMVSEINSCICMALFWALDHQSKVWPGWHAGGSPTHCSTPAAPQDCLSISYNRCWAPCGVQQQVSWAHGPEVVGQPERLCCGELLMKALQQRGKPTADKTPVPSVLRAAELGQCTSGSKTGHRRGLTTASYPSLKPCQASLGA
jgi:hypothetical protein